MPIENDNLPSASKEASSEKNFEPGTPTVRFIDVGIEHDRRREHERQVALAKQAALEAEQRRRAEEEAKRRAALEAELQRHAEEYEKRRADLDELYGWVLTKHRDLVDKFLRIAERKVSVLDDYGDENWDVLPQEIYKCLTKIAKHEPTISVPALSSKAQLTFTNDDLCGRYLVESLELEFREYHEARKNSLSAATEFRVLTGTEFEQYLAALLKENGFENVVARLQLAIKEPTLLLKRTGGPSLYRPKGTKGPSAIVQCRRS